MRVKCLKYLKSGWNRKGRGRNVDFKKGSRLGKGRGALKKGGYSLFMLHVSAAFEGEIFKFFWKGGALYMGGLSILWEDLITP